MLCRTSDSEIFSVHHIHIWGIRSHRINIYIERERGRDRQVSVSHIITISSDRRPTTDRGENLDYNVYTHHGYYSPDMSLQRAGVLVALQAIESGALVTSVRIYELE